MRFLLTGGILLALVAPALGQSTDISQVLSGKEIPLSLKLKELNSDWRRIRVSEIGKADDAGNMLNQLMQIGMMSEMGNDKKNGKGGKPGEDPMAAMLGMQMLGGLFGGLFGGGQKAEPAYYTRGMTVAMGSETFLITYKYNKPEMNLAAMMAADANGEEPDPTKLMADGKMTEDSLLSLTLLNLKAVSRMSDIRPFDMQKEIEENNAEGGGGLFDLMLKEQMNKGGDAEAEAISEPEFGEDPSEVSRQILQAVKKDPQLRTANLTVTYDGLTITLGGTVKSATLKKRAETLAKKALVEHNIRASVKNALIVRANG